MKNKTVYIVPAFFLVIILLAWMAFQWFFCRFYVPPEHMAIVTAKVGSDPQPGAILVEKGQKGIWREVLPEGRYFLNPINYDVQIERAQEIPLGKVGIVTSKVGKPLAPGEILASDKESQGVWKETLGPGLYRLNPRGYSIEIVDAVVVPVGYVGVVTSQTGTPAPTGKFAGPGEKGVLRDILHPGMYYINPRAYQVNVLEVGMNQVSLTNEQGGVIKTKNQLISTNRELNELTDKMIMNQQAVRRKERFAKQNISPEERARRIHQRNNPRQRTSSYRTSKLGQSTSDVVYAFDSNVDFPSRDGFRIVIDMTVEFELLPENIPTIYLLYGDLPQVVEKIILPQVLSVSRIMGSSYKAQDFIMGDGREKFQNNLRDGLYNIMDEKKIIIHNAIIRNVNIPDTILKPIQQSSIAVENNLTNQALQETAKILAQLNSQTALIDQKKKEVHQETMKKVAEIDATKSQDVVMINAETELEVARIKEKCAQIEAQISQMKGQAQVQADFAIANEKALGLKMKADLLKEPGALAELKLVQALDKKLKVRIIHAGEGTLWTDLKQATIQAK